MLLSQDGGRGGGGSGGRYDAGNNKFGNHGPASWVNLTMKDGGTIVQLQKTFDEREDLYMGDSDRSQALDFGINDNYVSPGFLAQPSITKAFLLQGDPFANETVDPGSIPTRFGKLDTGFSHTDTLRDSEFSDSLTHQLFQDPNFHIPLEKQWPAIAITEPSSFSENDFGMPHHRGPAAATGESPVLESFDQDLLAQRVSGQAASAGGSHRQDRFRQQHSGLELSGQYQTLLQSSPLSNWPSSSAGFTTVPQLPENHQGPLNAPILGIARGIFPGFFSNPDPSEDGFYGW